MKRLPIFSRAEAVHATKDAFFHASRDRWHYIALVVERDVVKNLLVASVHALEPIFDDGGQLESVGRIVALAARQSACEHMAVTVVVLQPLTLQCGTAGSCTE